MKLAAHLQPKREMIVEQTPGEDDEEKHKQKKRRSRVLYIFDEPTTGLHFDDVSKLLSAFRKLIDTGGSILVIEHNLDVIKAADWVIDLGPEGGGRGGEVVVTGTPETVSQCKESYTGQWLSRILVSSDNSPGQSQCPNDILAS
jgi:excinuclease ABC subunit A